MNIDQELDITKRISGGDKLAFKELFDLYYKPLCVYAIKYIDNFEEAEDIVQSLLASFWVRFSSKEFSGSLRSYLFSSVRNNCIRSSKSKPNISLDFIDYNMEAEETFDFVEKAETDYTFIYREIDKLPPQCRKVFDAVIVNNMKYKEAAEMLGVSVNTVKTQLSRAMKQLRKSIEHIIVLFLI